MPRPRFIINRLASIIIFLGSLVWCCPGHPAVTIDAPAKVAAGQPAIVQTAGATLVGWRPNGDATIKLGIMPKGDSCWVWTAPKAGQYELIALEMTADLPSDWATCKIIVGEGPIPPQPGKWRVAFFIESDQLDNLPAGQGELVAGLVFRRALAAKGHRVLGIYDVDARDRNGKIPPDLAPFYAAVEGDPLPRVCLAPLDDGAVTDYPLPADEGAFWQLLEGAGPKSEIHNPKSESPEPCATTTPITASSSGHPQPKTAAGSACRGGQCAAPRRR